MAGFVVDDYQKIFINAIFGELGIGTFQGTITWVEWDGSTGYEVQEAAYGLMGGSWTNPDVIKTYLKTNICTFDYSEPVPEGLYALGL